jgi:hypothetical protein
MHLLTKIILDLDAAYKISPWTEEYRQFIKSAILNLRELANLLEKREAGHCGAIQAAKDAVFLATIRKG